MVEKVREGTAPCDHRMPNGAPAVAGQWDSNRTVHLICQYCFETRSYRADSFDLVAKQSWLEGRIGGQGAEPKLILASPVRPPQRGLWKFIWLLVEERINSWLKR